MGTDLAIGTGIIPAETADGPIEPPAPVLDLS
jgi:hypothetical protein